MLPARKIANQIDYLGGKPTVTSKTVETSPDAKKMLRYDLHNERETLTNYRQRIQQAEALGEYALNEVLRTIVAQE